MLTMCLKSTLNLQLTNDQLKRGIPFSQLVCIRDFFFHYLLDYLLQSHAQILGYIS